MTKSFNVGHIWVVFILFSSSITMKMYTKSYIQLASSLCEHNFTYFLYILVYIENPAAVLVHQKCTEHVLRNINCERREYIVL
jgi:hypothetical protein